MRKIISISLIVLLLISNLGIAHNTHFCGGQAVQESFSFGIQNLHCGMSEMEECPSHILNGDQINTKPCCENHHDVIAVDAIADIQLSIIELNPVFFISFIYSFFQTVVFDQQAKNEFAYYFPPPIKQDFQVLFQSFLI